MEVLLLNIVQKVISLIDFVFTLDNVEKPCSQSTAEIGSQWQLI